MGVAAFVTLTTVTREPAVPAGSGAGEPTVVFTRLLGAGSTVGQADVAVVEVPASLRPGQAFAGVQPVLGHVVAGAVQPGEVATRSRLVAPDLLTGRPAGEVAMTVPVPGAAGTGVRPGTRVDLYTTGTGDKPVSDAVVLAVVGVAATEAREESGGAWGVAAPPRLTLALDPEAAARLARHLSALGAGEEFVLAIRRPQATDQ